MVCCCLCVFASVTSELIPSHGNLAFRGSTAQKTNGEYIVRAFGLTSRSRTRLAVRDPEGSVYTRYNIELGVMNLVQRFKYEKFGYKQTCCSLDVTYLKCGVKDHSDAICQRHMCDMNYTTLISRDCPSFCRRVQFTKSKLKRACYSWRIKGSIPTPVKAQECFMC